MMSRSRTYIVYALLTALVGGHLYDIALRQEHWPFSNYPMFATVMNSELNTYQIVCLTTVPGGGEREVPFDGRAIPALPPYKFQNTLRRYDTGSKADPAKLRRLLADYLETYEARRKAGLHDGPAVHGLRLYLVHIPLQLPPVPVNLKTLQWQDARLVIEVRGTVLS